jgi:hypothetical protein
MGRQGASFEKYPPGKHFRGKSIAYVFRSSDLGGPQESHINEFFWMAILGLNSSRDNIPP